MLLAIDIGNTNIKLGVWNGRSWVQQWRLRTVHHKTTDEYAVSVKGLLREHNLKHAIDAVIMASVVPPLTAVFAKLSEAYLGQTAVQINAQLDTGIAILTDDPTAVGADRIVNAAAAHVKYPGASIIVDMGTATKFELLTASGEFHGGVIAPGLRITADALASRAAQLRQVELVAPPQTIGKNTIHAIQSGLIYGYVGLVEGILERLLREHPDQGQPIQIIGTGGLIHHIAPHTDLFQFIDPSLTLTGLCIVHERVR
jgi:type III pantothenate kinase